MSNDTYKQVIAGVIERKAVIEELTAAIGEAKAIISKWQAEKGRMEARRLARLEAELSNGSMEV